MMYLHVLQHPVAYLARPQYPKPAYPPQPVKVSTQPAPPTRAPAPAITAVRPLWKNVSVVPTNGIATMKITFC